MAKKFILLLIMFFVFVSCETTKTIVKKRQETAVAESSASDDLFSGEEKEESAEKPAEKTEEGGVQDEIKPGEDTLAVIGRYVLTKEKYKIILNYMKERYDYKLTPAQEKEFIQYIVNKKLMAMEARKQGYAEKKKIRIKYEWDFDDIVSHEFYEDRVEKKSRVTASQARNYYNKYKEDFIEVKGQHILVKNKKLADSLYKRLISGENFDDLARKYSEDETTKSSGGDLGYFTKGAMVKEFEETAFTLSRGEISEPVKTIYGYHIIKVTDKRKISFDESKDKIVRMIKNKKKKAVFDGLMEKLKKKYNVVINEDVLK